MTKIEMVTYMKDFIAQIKKHLDIDIWFPDDVEKLPKGFIEDSYKWTKNIVQNQLAAYLEEYKKTPEKMWKYYQDMCLENEMPECLALKKLATDLKAAIRSKAPIYLKGKVNAQKKAAAKGNL